MSTFLFVGLLVLSAIASPLWAQGAAPDGWQFVSVRPNTAPGSSIVHDGSAYGLVIAGNGEQITDGRWVRRVTLPQAQYVSFSARVRATNIEMMSRNVIAALVWMDEAGKEITDRDFAATTAPADAQGWRKVSAVFKVPAKAKLAQMELRLRWSPNGQVEWRDAEVKPSAAPAARKVKIATVYHRPRATHSAQENLDQFAKFIDEAGAKKADIVCLPEGSTVIGRGSDYIGTSESIPGPSTEFLGKVAVRNHTYIVAGIYERDGEGVYNTAVLIDRNGKVVGKYRKICLPTSEYNAGLAPGSEYPIFDTDFGKIGIMICWDVVYPEVSRELTARGAEMILMPIWGGNETLCKARAIENQIPLVTSSYDLHSAIYDQAGEAKAQATDKVSSVVIADINLAEPMYWKWTGNWQSRIWLEGPVRKDSADAVAQTTKAN